MFDLQSLIHYALHFLAPGLVSWIFFRSIWKMSWLLMVVTMLVDLDHLLASPIFDAGRCSINFHPLHTHFAIGIYVILLLVPNKYVRMIAVGLILHMITDYQDCLWAG